MNRSRIKRIRQLVALWLAPWLAPSGGIKFGASLGLNTLRSTGNVFTTDYPTRDTSPR